MRVRVRVRIGVRVRVRVRVRVMVRVGVRVRVRVTLPSSQCWISSAEALMLVKEKHCGLKSHGAPTMATANIHAAHVAESVLVLVL